MIEEKMNKAFVLIRFDKTFNEVYRNGIKSGLEEIGWACDRADERWDTPEIVCTICKSIQEAKLVIVDVTGKNSNVFLELGLSFGLEKNVLLITQDYNDLPFDIRNFRAIEYNPQSLGELQKKLQEAIKNLRLIGTESRTPTTFVNPYIQIEKRKWKIEHSNKLKDEFFKPWLSKIGAYNDEYCKIDAVYSREMDKMVPLKPREPDDIQFYDEAMSHLKNYRPILTDWEKLKQITLTMNEELAILFEEIRALVIKKIDIPYWCPNYSYDEPEEYLCPNTFIRAIYEELYWRITKDTTQFIGNKYIEHRNYGDKKFYLFNWSDRKLAKSPEEELMKKAQRLFKELIEDEECRDKTRVFITKEKEIYNNAIEKVKKDIKDLIKSIELGNIIKGNCQHCPV